MEIKLLSVLVILFATVANSSSASIKNVLKTCIQDSQCNNAAMFCDHDFPSFIGSCTKKHMNGHKCTFDRHCMSGKCNWNKCVANKPKKDGRCSKDQHHECIDSQYCHKNKCTNRSTSGACTKNEECLSNKCKILWCQKPDSHHSTTTTTTKKNKG